MAQLFLAVVVSSVCLSSGLQHFGLERAFAQQTTPENLAYSSYESAKYRLLNEIRQARFRVVLITSEMTDGDFATALHSMKIRNKFVQVLLAEESANLYNSRHAYLEKADVPVYLTSSYRRRFGTKSYLLVDNLVLEFNVPAAPRKSTEVQVKTSAFQPGEILAAFNKGYKPKIMPTRAKTPTHIHPQNEHSNAKMRMKARSINPNSSLGSIPKRLPQETKHQSIRSGKLPPEDTVRPLRELSEDQMRLENESELNNE